MLPFQAPLVYGNEVVYNPWYDGTELLAVDSAIVSSSAFTDRVGKSWLTSGAAKASQTDFPITYPLAPQTGYYLNNAWMRTAAGVIASSVFTSSWTLDYWFKNESYYATGNNFNYFTALFSTTTTNYTSRLLFGPASSNDNNKVTLWNNAQSPNAYQATTNNSAFRSTSWTHVAFVYNGTRINIYINGTFYDYVTRTITATSGSNYFGPWGLSSTVGSRPILERYRLRSGVIWTSDFDINHIYP